jgi:hypothetical protein
MNAVAHQAAAVHDLLTLALTRLKLRAFNYSCADGAIHVNRELPRQSLRDETFGADTDELILRKRAQGYGLPRRRPISRLRSTRETPEEKALYLLP